MNIKHYNINNDLTIDVDSNIDLYHKNLTHLPVKFGIVNGYFTCSKNKLTTLIGTPKEIIKWFDCSYNNLTTLKGSPKNIYSDFYSNNNELTTLNHLPEKIKGVFYCHKNNLNSLDELSIYNLKKNIIKNWYKELNPKIKYEWFVKHLKDDPELMDIIKK